VPGISFVRELGGISEYELKSNGLKILLAPDASSPVTGFMVTYHVGSRNEAIGYTGSTHLLEHLLFKGSVKFNREKGTQMDKLLESKGAVVNATTWFDRTNYYEIIPRDVLPLAIEIEADRMRTARITQKDKESEMPIVWNEFERGENLPIEALDKQVWATAYQAHPYHHSTIGWRSDIENVSIERLQQFYNDYYWPNNATVTVVGGFDPKEALTLIKKHFGVHPKAPKAFPPVYTTEPPQEGERRAVVRRAGVDMVGIAHKIPEGNHADIPALIVLGALLSGDKASRLHRALVDTAKATEAQTLCYQLFDPGLLMTYVTLPKGIKHEAVERIVKEELAKLQSTPVSTKELARIKRQVRVEMANQRDGAYTFLSSLNESIATGDWTRFVTLGPALAKVTAADVKRVAKTYFSDDQATIGWFINTAT
ncbi:MAG: pitrilysin family protein, partial [Patescibacteria group bacterium]